MIWLVDDKGWYWELTFAWEYTRHSKIDLYEVWATVMNSSPPALENYFAIPIPVFTDWWNANAC